MNFSVDYCKKAYPAVAVVGSYKHAHKSQLELWIILSLKKLRQSQMVGDDSNIISSERLI